MQKSDKLKIFVIYTTRDECIDINSLRVVNSMLSKFGHVFIDLIHNNSVNHQQRVFDELSKASAIVIIKSDKLQESEWATLEINEAIKRKIPIIGYCIPKKSNNIIEFEFLPIQSV